MNKAERMKSLENHFSDNKSFELGAENDFVRFVVQDFEVYIYSVNSVDPISGENAVAFILEARCMYDWRVAVKYENNRFSEFISEASDIVKVLGIVGFKIDRSLCSCI